MLLGSFSEAGFRVVADNAIDLLVGTQAAGAGHVGANIRKVGQTLHADLGRLNATVLRQTDQLDATMKGGLGKVADGLGSLKTLSAISVGVQAVGFAAVAYQLHKVGGRLEGLHEDMKRQGAELIASQHAMSAQVELLTDVAKRSLATQEKILETLVTSRTVEAQQLVRQGWDNLVHGYDEDAIDRFRRSTEYDNTVYVAHAALGDLYLKRGDKAKAGEHLERAVRFANGAGRDFELLARRRFARFLEDEGRTANAASELEEAVRLGSDAVERLRLAELHAQLGRKDEALIGMREAVAADPKLFVAAMGSETLSGLGRVTAEALIDVDAEHRQRVLAAIERVCGVVDRMDDLAAMAAADSDAVIVAIGRSLVRQVANLRAEGSRIVEELLTAPFIDLPPLRRSAEKLAGEEDLEAAVRSVAIRVSQPARAADTALRKHLAGAPTGPPEVRPTPLERAGEWAAAAGGFLSVLAGAVILIAGVAVYRDEAPRGAAIPAVLLTTLVAAVLAVPGLLVLRWVSSREQRRTQVRAEWDRAHAVWERNLVTMRAARRTKMNAAACALAQWGARFAHPVLAEVTAANCRLDDDADLGG